VIAIIKQQEVLKQEQQLNQLRLLKPIKKPKLNQPKKKNPKINLKPELL
jgi:hypothetical protein